MVNKYINEALYRAKFELINDEEPYYGEVTELRGVWASQGKPWKNAGTIWWKSLTAGW